MFRCLCFTQLRQFSNSSNFLARYSRDVLRSREKLKELSKTKPETTPHPVNIPYASDIIPVRPAQHLVRALGFTVATGAVAFAVAVVSDLERTRRQLRNVVADATDFFKNAFKQSNPDEVQWKDLSAGDRTAAVLIGLNFVVFALWKVKSLQPLMWRYFTNSYASRSLCVPMFLSAFSHSSFIHFGLNMYVVYSFTNVAIDKFLGTDQFWAFYCTAAVVSSFISLAHKSVVRSGVRALGASGAILGLLAYTCMKITDARLKIVFIPNFDFSAESAIIGVILFDLVGLLFRFRLFDHAAHLGGSLFGVFYALYGEKLIWDDYGSLIETMYLKLRGSSN